MIQETLFNIPYYTLPTLNFKVKKKQLTNLLKSYPEKKQGIQPFSTNRQSNRDGLAQGFSKIGETDNFKKKCCLKKLSRSTHMSNRR